MVRNGVIGIGVDNNFFSGADTWIDDQVYPRQEGYMTVEEKRELCDYMIQRLLNYRAELGQ
jgi:hypothetical protein